MKTTRRQFLKSLLATAATAAIAPQVLVESVHGASDLTAHERDVAADVMGLRSKQWPGFSNSVHVKFTESETAFSYITYPVLGTDIAGNTGYGQITLPKDTPEEEVRAELEAAGKRMFNGPVRATWADESEVRDRQILWGRPGGQMPVGVLSVDEIEEAWRQAGEERPDEPERDNRGGYLVPREYQAELMCLFYDGPISKLISRTECIRTHPGARASWGDNMYDSEPKII